MARVLVLFAHPAQRHSRINRAMAEAAQSVKDVTFVDLYARYPRFKIDIDAEQAQLLEHDVIVLQFPIYWYSTPSILKEWQDLVLEFGFAYGPGGDSLAGKWLLPVVSLGGAEGAYQESGHNRFPLPTLLSPLMATAHLCQMRYLPPLPLFAAHKAREDGRGDAHVEVYTRLLEALRDGRLEPPQAELMDPANLPVREGA